MDTTYYANANEEFDGKMDDDGERRQGIDRRGSLDRRKQERRADSARKMRLTPQEIAALLNGSR